MRQPVYALLFASALMVAACGSAPEPASAPKPPTGVKAGLYRNGVLIETWEKKGYSTEKARNKTDDCNAPKIRAAVYDVRGLLHRVAKELRVRISKKLYELEG